MEKLGLSAVIQKISLGEIDLDEISEVLRASEMVIKSYRSEVQGLQEVEQNLKQSFSEEQKAVDDLTRRLVELHEENRLAREVFRTEIQGKMQLLDLATPLDLEALNMTGLITQREQLQKQMNKVLRHSTGRERPL